MIVIFKSKSLKIAVLMEFRKSEPEFGAPEFLKTVDLSTVENVSRPPCTLPDPSSEVFEFMQIDVDYYTAVLPGKF